MESSKRLRQQYTPGRHHHSLLLHLKQKQRPTVLAYTKEGKDKSGPKAAWRGKGRKRGHSKLDTQGRHYPLSRPPNYKDKHAILPTDKHFRAASLNGKAVPSCQAVCGLVVTGVWKDHWCGGRSVATRTPLTCLIAALPRPYNYWQYYTLTATAFM